MKKQILSLSIISFLYLSCEKKMDSDTQLYSSIDETYAGAFDTFYQYIKVLNDNQFNEEKMSEFFNQNFSMIIGSPTLTLTAIPEITATYNGIRNSTYPFICNPAEFNELKLARLSYMPLTKNSVNISLLDVFLCSENKTPSYKMAFIYHMIYDERKEKWLMNALTELNPQNYPLNWKQVEIMEPFKYLGKKEISEIKPLLASELAKGNKRID